MGQTVKEPMPIMVCYVKPEQALNECMALMKQKRTRHLPVIDDEILVGIVYIEDVLKHTIAEKKICHPEP